MYKQRVGKDKIPRGRRMIQRLTVLCRGPVDRDEDKDPRGLSENASQ